MKTVDTTVKISVGEWNTLYFTAILYKKEPTTVLLLAHVERVSGKDPLTTEEVLKRADLAIRMEHAATPLLDEYTAYLHTSTFVTTKIGFGEGK